MFSDCCGAVVRFQDICSRCGEHCEPMVDSDDGYDAARDAYLTGEGPAVTDRQRQEDEDWAYEMRHFHDANGAW
jgi:nanoRNase/pAp phosphatase (c-di-AMP/oligoRNAs hydrolase)